MSVRMMSLVWELDLPDSEKLVLLALADCANDEGGCWPSVDTLARKCSKGERTVQNCIRTLCVKGHLTRQERHSTSCYYIVHPIVRLADPAEVAPRSERTLTPQPLHPDPAAAAPKSSKNHQEPSEDLPAEPPLSRKEILEAWHQRMVPLGFPAVAKMTGQRERQLSARLKDSTLEEWQRAMDALERSKFCRGENPRGWRADFDFLLQPKSFTKLLEGAYDH